MSTRENYWPSGRQKRNFVTNPSNGQFNNFNLNHQGNPYHFVGSGSNNIVARRSSNDTRQGNYVPSNENTLHGPKKAFHIIHKSDSRRNLPSSSSSSNYYLNNNREEENYRSKALNKSASSNSSTLSLHIAAYENANEGNTNSMNNNDSNMGDERINRKRKNDKQIDSTTAASNIQDQFSLPRQQQKNDENQKPETTQFRLSQRPFDVPTNSKPPGLLNYNQNEKFFAAPTQSHDSYLTIPQGYNHRHHQFQPSTSGYGSQTTPKRMLNVLIPKSRQQQQPSILALPPPTPSSSSIASSTSFTPLVIPAVSKSSSSIGLNALPRLPRPGGPKIHFGGTGFPPPSLRRISLPKKEVGDTPETKYISEKEIMTWKGYKFQNDNNEYKVCEETKQRLANIKTSMIFSCLPPPGALTDENYDPFADSDDDENENNKPEDGKSNWRKNKYKSYSKLVSMRNSGSSAASLHPSMTLEEYIKNLKISYIKAERKPDYNCDKQWTFDMCSRHEENFEEINNEFDRMEAQASNSLVPMGNRESADATVDVAESSSNENMSPVNELLEKSDPLAKDSSLKNNQLPAAASSSSSRYRNPIPSAFSISSDSSDVDNNANVSALLSPPSLIPPPRRVAFKSPPKKKLRRSLTPYHHQRTATTAAATTRTLASASTSELFVVENKNNVKAIQGNPKSQQSPPKKKKKRSKDEPSSSSTTTTKPASSSSRSSSTSRKMKPNTSQQQQQKKSNNTQSSNLSSQSSQNERPQRIRRPASRYEEY